MIPSHLIQSISTYIQKKIPKLQLCKLKWSQDDVDEDDCKIEQFIQGPIINFARTMVFGRV